MSKETSISWTDHTFNPWWGCVKISPGCANCYADAFSKRTGHDIWGADKPRRFFGDKHWNEPLAWNAAAAKANAGLADHAPFGQTRPRVFCASMADVFEDRTDLVESRQRLLQLIDDTPNLDWLLLTKRPENVRRLLEEVSNGNVSDFRHMPNVWLGTTVENQEYADRRIPELLKIPARVRFLSVEPQLGLVDLSEWIPVESDRDGSWRRDSRYGETSEVAWVICGGESGGKRRPFEIEWAQSLADQCAAAGVAFHMKQDAAFKSGEQGRIPDQLWNRKQFPTNQ